MKRLNLSEVIAGVLFAAFAVLGAGSAAAAPKHDDPAELKAPWAAGRQWLSFRAGYAKSSVSDAADGSVGGGFGYSRMLNKKKLYKWTLFKNFSAGAYAQLDQLGHFDKAAEIELPMTVELVRHFRWNSAYLRPYLGFGAGAFYRKLYRTGADIGLVRTGTYVTFGANTPLDGTKVLGLDVRAAQVNSQNEGVNPVFGAGEKTAMHWSVKLNYALAY